MRDRVMSPLFWAGVIGGIKLILDSFGAPIIADAQVNAIANGLAALATVAGVVASYGAKCLDKGEGTE